MVSLQINTEVLPPLEVFPYFGRTIAFTNSNWPVVYQNLRKAQRRWGMIARVLVKTGATVRAHWMMYKAVAQSLILYSSEIWVVMEAMIKILEGFHHRTARGITGMTAARGAGG